jgi:hypothetical protein
MPEKDRASSIGRQILLGLAGILAAFGLIGFGWWLHPDAESQLPVTHAIATIDKPAPMESFAQAKARAAVQGRAIQTTELSVPRPAQAHPAPHNINPSAPEPTSMPGAADNVPIDANRALSLFADDIAREENREDDHEEKFDIPTLRKKLESAFPNPDPSADLRSGLDAWLAQLPPEQRAHITIVTAECRDMYCRILIAINSFHIRQINGQSVWGFANGIDVRTVQQSLYSQPWWQVMVSRDVAIQEKPTQGEGYLLFSVYFKLSTSN